MGLEKQSVGTRLDEEVVARLKEICDAENRTLSSLLETIVKDYLKSKDLL